MKRSLLTKYLRLETMVMPILLGLFGIGLLVRATAGEGGTMAYAAAAGVLIVAAAALLFRAARKL